MVNAPIVSQGDMPDQFAVKAFKFNALVYLLKPI